MRRLPQCLLLAVLLSSRSLCAQSVWDGGAGTSLWSDAANWNPNGVPTSVGGVQFTGTGPYSINLNGDRATLSVLFSGTSSYTLAGSSLAVLSGSLSVLAPASGTATHVISSNVSFGSSAAINIAANSILTLGGTTSGSTLAKSGSGKLLISGPASFSGGATVSDGILQVGNGSGGTFSGNIANNSNVTFFNHSLSTYAGDISGSGSLRKEGAATLVLSGANTFSGGITIAGGNIDIGGGGSTGSISSNIASVGVTIFNRTTDYTYSGTISGSGSVYKVGANTLTLNGANNFTGSLHLEGGLLNFSSTSLGSSSNVIFHGGGLQWRSGNTLDISSRTVTIDSGGGTFDTNGNNITFANSIGDNGTGGITKAGSGTLTLSASNSYHGTTTVSGGALKISHLKAVPGSIVNNSLVTLAVGGTFAPDMSGSGAFQIGAGAFITLAGDYTHSGGTTISQGVVTLGTGASMAGNIAIASAAAGTRFQFGNDTDYTYSGTISGVGAVYMVGDAKLTLTGINTFSGGMLLASGTTAFSASSNLGTGKIDFQGGTLQWLPGNTTDISTRTVTADAFSGATLDTNGNNVTFAQRIGGSGLVTKIGSGTLTLASGVPDGQALGIVAGSVQLGNGGSLTSGSATITNNSALFLNHSGDTTLAGVISGSGSLTKFGSGNTVLTAANNYTGGTTISAGTLQIGDSGTTGSISGNVVNNGTLLFKRSDNLAFGGVISGTGSLTNSGAGILTLTGSNTYTGNTTITSGALTVSGVLGGGNYGGNISLGASLNFTGTSAQTLSGVITGGSALVQVGSSALTLTGTSATTGSVYTSGTGGIFITSGSHVFSDMNVGLYYTGGSGVVTVTGSSTKVETDNSTWLGLGYNSSNKYSGSLTITNGATYTDSGYGIQIGSSNAAGSNVIVSGSAHLYATQIYGNETFTLDQGTLHFTQSGSLSVASTQILSGGGIIDTGAFVVTASTSLSGPGQLTKTGSGTLAFTGSFNPTGDTSIAAGTLKLAGSVGSGTYAGNFAISQGGALHYANASNQTLSGVISGSGGLVCDSNLNILTLSGSNTYTGNTTITSGALTVSGVLGGGNYGGNISLGASLNFTGTSAQTLSGLITGGSALVQVGTGALTLTGTSATTGSVYTSGTGGVFITSGSHVFSDVNVGLYYTGGSGAVTVSGSSTKVKTDNSTWLGLGYNGSNKYSGSLTITNGATYTAAGYGIQIGSSNAAGSNVIVSGSAHLYATQIYGTETFTLDQGTLHFTQSGSLSVASTKILSGGGIIDTGAYAVTASTTITGAGQLTKKGSGTLALTAANVATGTVSVGEGTLLIKGSYVGDAAVSAGAALTGSGTIGGTLQVSGTVSPGSSPGVLTAGAVALEEGGALLFEINNATGTLGTNWDLLDTNGALTINSTDEDAFTISLHSLAMSGLPGEAANFDPLGSYTWTFLTADGGITGYDPETFVIDSSGFLNTAPGTWRVAQIGNTLALTYNVVPEPAALSLLLAGLAFVVTARRPSRE